MNNIDLTFYDRIKDTYVIPKEYPCSDYIDMLKQDEVPKNVMKGTDYYSRKFITLKIGGSVRLNTGKMKFFKSGQVFFERYTGQPYLQSAYFEDTFISTCGGTSEEQYQLINDLVDGKVVKILEHHRPTGWKTDCIIANMDYWENLFAKKIQKQWIKCRYTPNYTICKNILNRQFDEYLEEIG